MGRIFDHIDLRVSDLRVAGPFYIALLPALGFARREDVEGWIQFAAGADGATEFFGITESAGHRSNGNRIAFAAANRARVDDLAQVAVRAGAQNMEGPMDYEEGYYAVFFEDPCGNRLEICHRTRNAPAMEGA
jgi:predicted enzyme related to lactoylglutathione lyase